MGRISGDLEKMVAKLYTYSIKHKVKAIYFENVSLVKLKEFRQVLTHLKLLPEILSPLTAQLSHLTSPRLRLLLTEDTDNGLYPSELQSLIQSFETMIVWKRP